LLRQVLHTEQRALQFSGHTLALQRGHVSRRDCIRKRVLGKEVWCVPWQIYRTLPCWICRPMPWQICRTVPW
jgi:hypothetical protein